MNSVLWAYFMCACLLARSQAKSSEEALHLRPTSSKSQPGPRVYLEYGDFLGAKNGSIETFLSIPFADPPVGHLRYRNPQPISRKFPNFDATRIGPACPQQDWKAGTTSLSDIIKSLNDLGTATTPAFESQGVGQEDCLYLNVFRPAGIRKGTARVPVMVFFHGGSFVSGSGLKVPGQNLVARSALLKKPIIYVSPNYRLGAFGFLGGRQVGKEGVGNLGLKDQWLALQWVQKHIGEFGGDPAQVTIFGHSAGSMAVSNLLYAHGGKAQKLFRGAICESGIALHTERLSEGAGQVIFNSVVKKVGCSGHHNPLSCLREVPASKLMAAQNQLPGFYAYDAYPLPFMPYVDGGIVPESPANAFAHGKFAHVPVIAGNAEDEGTVLILGQTNITTQAELATYLRGLYPRMGERTLKAVLAAYPSDPRMGSPFGQSVPGPTPLFKQQSALIGDAVIISRRRGFLRQVQSQVPAWGYEDVALKDTHIVGAYHGGELLSVFADPMKNSTTRSRDFQARWIAFAYNLDPNVPGLPVWKRYGSGTGMIMKFDKSGSNGMINDNYREQPMDIFIKNEESFIWT